MINSWPVDPQPRRPVAPWADRLQAQAEEHARWQRALEDMLSAVWHEEREWNRNQFLEGGPR